MCELTGDPLYHCHHDWCARSPVARPNIASKDVRKGYVPPPRAALCINMYVHHSSMLRRMSTRAGRRRRAWTILASLHRRSAAMACKRTPASLRHICHTDVIRVKCIYTRHLCNIMCSRCLRAQANSWALRRHWCNIRCHC